jgi:hypothetical protein
MQFYPPQLIISPDGRYYWDFEKRRWTRLPTNGNPLFYIILGAAITIGILYLIFWM